MIDPEIPGPDALEQRVPRDLPDGSLDLPLAPDDAPLVEGERDEPRPQPIDTPGVAALSDEDPPLAGRPDAPWRGPALR
jgi:hypothetical protein